MQLSVLLSLHVTQPTWRPKSGYMTCCSSVLDLQTAGKGQFRKFAFQHAIMSYQNKYGRYDVEVAVGMV